MYCYVKYHYIYSNNNDINWRLIYYFRKQLKFANRYWVFGRFYYNLFCPSRPVISYILQCIFGNLNRFPGVRKSDICTARGPRDGRSTAFFRGIRFRTKIYRGYRFRAYDQYLYLFCCINTCYLHVPANRRMYITTDKNDDRRIGFGTLRAKKR